MLNEKRQGRSRTIGLIPVVFLAFLTGFLVIFDLGGPTYEPPYLAFIFQMVFVLGISIAVAVVSARAYLMSGSLNVVLLGAALLISGLASAVSIWGITPSISPGLTTNEAVTIGNIGILIASIFQLLSALTTWAGTNTTELARRKTALTITYFAGLILVLVLSLLANFNKFPAFLTNTGPTDLRIAVLTASIVLVLTASLLFGSRYLQNRSSVLYWYTLALALFGLSLISAAFTVHLGEALNWASRLALYLSGIFFFLALQSRESKKEVTVGLTERWADAFRNDREQVAALFANMTEGFFYGKIVTDTNGKPIDTIFLDVNQAFETTNGVKRENILGKRWTEVFPKLKNDPSDWLAPYARAALQGESTSFEKHSPSTGKWYHMTVYSPQKGHFVSISEDITERKRAEEELKRSNAELKQFAYVASHDLQEPLRMVTVYASLLNKKHGDELSDQTKEYIRFITEGAENMRQLVTDLLQYSRVDVQNKPFALVDMNTVVAASIKTMQGAIDESGAEVVVERLPTVWADEMLIGLVVQNLLSNAIKFRETEAPKINIFAKQGANEWTIAVKDNGIGIDPKYHGKLFQMFQRLHTRDEYPGTGIGLAIAKKIVERHGGRIWVESDGKSGSTFYFTIPMRS